LLVALLGTLLLVSATVGTGIAIAVSQPRRAWHIPLGSRSLVIGEIVPKQIALISPEPIAVAMSRPMRWLAKITAPFVWLLERSSAGIFQLLGLSRESRNHVTAEELHLVVAEAQSAGVLEEDERAMISGIVRLADRPVREVMTPRTEIDWIDVNATPDEVRVALLETPHSRIPVAGSRQHKSAHPSHIRLLVLGICELRSLLHSPRCSNHPPGQLVIEPSEGRGDPPANPRRANRGEKYSRTDESIEFRVGRCDLRQPLHPSHDSTVYRPPQPVVRGVMARRSDRGEDESVLDAEIHLAGAEWRVDVGCAPGEVDSPDVECSVDTVRHAEARLPDGPTRRLGLHQPREGLRPVGQDPPGRIFRAIHFLPFDDADQEVESALLGEENVRMIRGEARPEWDVHEMPIPRQGGAFALDAELSPRDAMRAVRREEPGRAHDFPPPPVAGRLLEQHFRTPGDVATVHHPNSAFDGDAGRIERMAEEALGDRLRKREHERELRVDARERELAGDAPGSIELNAVDRGADRQHLARHSCRLEERQGARVHDERSGLPGGLFSRFDQSRGTASPGQEQGGAEPRRAGAHDDRQFRLRHTKSPPTRAPGPSGQRPPRKIRGGTCTSRLAQPLLWARRG